MTDNHASNTATFKELFEPLAHQVEQDYGELSYLLRWIGDSMDRQLQQWRDSKLAGTLDGNGNPVVSDIPPDPCFLFCRAVMEFQIASVDARLNPDSENYCYGDST